MRLIVVSFLWEFSCLECLVERGAPKIETLAFIRESFCLESPVWWHKRHPTYFWFFQVLLIDSYNESFDWLWEISRL
jgi:hypothetical protein